MTTTVIFERRLARNVGLSLLAVMLALAALGGVVDRTVVGQVRSTVRGNLDAMLVTSVRSVTSWLDDRKALLSVLSQAPRVRSAVAQAARDPGGVALLRDLLKHVAGPFSFDHGALVNAQGVIVAGVNDASLKGKPLPQAAQPYLARALRGEACVTPPMLSDLGSAESVELLAFVGVAAPGASKPDLVLVLTLDASKFSALLDQTRPGKTGESEAFDREGRMLNESRYLDEIVAAGVLPQGTRSTILTLDLRNPGVDIRTGQRSQLPLKAQPLTQMIASAVQGGSGIDLDGYRDYRGVMCVAAWQWLEAYDFGVAVKLDRDEAYATVRTLRAVFVGLMALLAVSVVGLAAWAWVHGRNQRRLAEAQAKVERLGQYAIERKLGEGGMGEVYLGRHALMQRDTAVKIMRHASSDEDRQRFEREVRLGSRLTHPNTIAIYDYGHTTDGVFYYAMEYLQGLDLAKLVERFGPLPPGRVARLLAQVCDALAEAHEMSLIHRDVKPENIMVSLRGGVPDLVKVLDFGLVKSLDAASPRVTATTTICGTPAFMAPENVLGQPVDGRADLYAVAGVGYFLLTASLPFARASVMDTLMAHVSDAPRSFAALGFSVPPDLEAVLMRGLSKSPAERCSDAREMRNAFLACACVAQWTEEHAREWWRGHAQARETPAKTTELRVIAVATPPGP